MQLRDRRLNEAQKTREREEAKTVEETRRPVNGEMTKKKPNDRRPHRAYSFCAVFLFRFINRNRNRRVQKERLSFERNNFHGNKMAHC